VEKKTHQFILRHFFAGFLRGLGMVVGATLGVSLLFYILGKLALIPFLSDFITEIVKTVQANLSLIR